jgi:hypothetical protein
MEKWMIMRFKNEKHYYVWIDDELEERIERLTSMKKKYVFMHSLITIETAKLVC